MKKIFSLIAVVAVMLVGLAGNAMATFEDNHLIRIIYSKSTNVEVASDLGLLTDVLTSTNTALGDTLSLGQYFSGLAYTDLQVAFVAGGNSATTWYLSSQGDAAPVSGLNKGATLKSAWYYADSGYGSALTTVSVDKTSAKAYYNRLDLLGSAVGKFANFYTIGMGEANLAELATGVDLNLYSFPVSTYNLELAGIYAATIRTYLDGGGKLATAIVPQTVVPVPASLLLFGSGLLGLFGIRRKNANF